MNADTITFFDRPRNRAALLLLILAAGTFLRVWNLGRASFWVDEVNTYYCAKSFNETGTMRMPSGMVNERAPLYTVLTALAFRILPLDETGTRLPAALFGIVSIALTYALARRWFDARVGLLAAFFTAFSHFEVGWSRTARMYTLLQFLILLSAAAYAYGFEGEPGRGTTGSGVRGRLHPLFGALKGKGISPLWLLVFCALLAATFWGVHVLAVFLAVGVWVHLACMAALRLAAGGGRDRFVNKDFLAALVGLVAAGLVLMIPSAREMIRYFLSYTPPWAVGGSSAQNRLVLFEFLISAQRFPLAAFFFLGLLAAAARGHRTGWLAACLFVIPLALLTLVFTHRVPAYLFFVYPFFLMVAAYGFVNAVETEHARLAKTAGRGRWIRGAFLAAALSVFVVSPWLRITLHIPFFDDGVTNLAVTPEEWREASAAVRAGARPDDCIITSLPQVALYYGLKSDFCLNRAALEQSIAERFPVNAEGRRVDMYAGVVCIESLEELKSIVGSRTSGWIAVSQFHLENDHLIQPEARDFLNTSLGPPAKTRHGTVLWFRWSRASEAGR